MSKLIFGFGDKKAKKIPNSRNILGGKGCLLYTSDAADE